MTEGQTMPGYWKRVASGEILPARVRPLVRKWPRLVAATVALALLLISIALWRGCGGAPTSALSFHTAKRGDFLVSIVEGGSLRAVNEVIIRNELEGTSRIISIVPEGATVKRGDLLVELDSSDLQDRLNQQELTSESFRFAHEQAVQDLEIQKSTVESRIRDAELRLLFAESDLEKYQEGDWPQQRKNAESAITLLEEELLQARDRLNWTIELEKKGFATRTELEKDQLAVKRAQIQLDRAQEELRLMVKYDYPKRLLQLRSNRDNAASELDREKRRGEVQIAQQEANVLSRKRSMDLQNEKLAQLSEQIKLTKIHAPQDGLVVYASSGSGGRSDNLIEEGATVRQRQELIKLPDISSMLVELKVHETFVNQVTPGLLAYVTIDSMPDRRFVGSVRRVAPLPDTQSRYLNPNLKVYSTEVLIEQQLTDLKPGVSAHAEIIIANLTNVIAVPIQAVTTLKGQQVVYLADSGRPVPVEVGLNNDRFIEIRSGLTEGQRILLAPPVPTDAGETSRSALTTEELEAAASLIARTNGVAPPPNGPVTRPPGPTRETSRPAPSKQPSSKTSKPDRPPRSDRPSNTGR